MRKARKRPEQALQISVARYLRLALRPPTYWTSIDHGVGKLGPAEAGLRKLRGVQAGIADFVVIHPQGTDYRLGACVIWIELKAGKGDQSDAQVAFEKRMWSCGCAYYIARSIDAVQEILVSHGIPLFAAVYVRGSRVAA